MANSAPVIIVEYSNEWLALFAAEQARLAPLFPACVIEHIGSTAVPGLPAKPIIDIMVGAQSLAEIERSIEPLALLGYDYRPQHERVFPLRRYFAKPAAEGLAAHIHAVVKGTPFWVERLAFRDALRSSAELSLQYALLKRRLAAEFHEDREAYTNAKGSFIHSVLAGVGRALQDVG